MDSDNSKVQHVTKKSSDELLRKFADDDESPAKSKELVRAKRRRKSREGKENDDCESPSSNGQASKLGERRSLLPSPAPARKSAVLRQLGINGRVRLKGRDIRHKSLFGTIEKVGLIQLT
uniref:Uncharacterized protein n=1 Tax=Cannabis sativa TaxID=3483 RepID=A0A803QP05_CANSA